MEVENMKLFLNNQYYANLACYRKIKKIKRKPHMIVSAGAFTFFPTTLSNGKKVIEMSINVSGKTYDYFSGLKPNQIFFIKRKFKGGHLFSKSRIWDEEIYFHEKLSFENNIKVILTFESETEKAKFKLKK